MYPRGNTEKSTHAAANTSPNSGATGAFSWNNAPAEGTFKVPTFWLSSN